MTEEFGFTIKGDNWRFLLQITSAIGFPDQTFHWGGYDTECTVEIEMPNYNAKGGIYISTYDIYSFYNELKDCYQSLQGNAKLTSYEGNLNVDILFDELGHTHVYGTFRANVSDNSELTFDLVSDQTHLRETLNSLKRIVDVYGDQFGKRNSN